MMKNVKITKKFWAAAMILAVLLSFYIKDTLIAKADGIDLEDVESGVTIMLYDNTNGLATSEANDVYQTPDGFIWIGSYSGLYRYDGREFAKFGSDSRLSSVVTIYMDSKGILWVGTNDNGVARYEKGEFTFYTRNDGLHSDTIRDIVEDSEGNVIVSTTEGVCYFDQQYNLKLLDNPQINNEYVMELKKEGDNIYAATMTGKFFCINHLKVTQFYSSGDYDFVVNCVYPDPHSEGCVYLGTLESEIIYADMANGMKILKRYEVSPLTTINSLGIVSDNIWVCAGNGIGYIDKNGNINQLSGLPMDNSVHSVFEDYEGNLWFTSTRQGVMKMVSNKFSNINRIAGINTGVVNSTCLKDGILYVGTDTGLIQLDKNYNVITNKLTEYFDGARIRSIKIDSKGNIWFCTFSEHGLVCLEPNGELVNLNKSNGFASDRVRTCTELSDGRLAVSVSGGVYLIENYKIVKTLDASNGLTNIEILTICEADDGRLYLGSDGDGMYIVDLDRNNVTYKGKDDGLSSEVLLRIKKDVNNGVFWLISSNSIAYMKDEKITTVTNFPYNNNFDVFSTENGMVWVLSSNGIYVVKAQDMINNTENMIFVKYDSSNGMSCVSTANSRSYIREDGMIYISGSTGVSTININTAFGNDKPVKITIPSVTVDGKEYYIDKNGTVTIPSSAKRVTINAYALTYSLRDPMVSYDLSGFDEESNTGTVSTLDRISYTNLPGGSYTFTFNVLDSMSGGAQNNMTLKIVKKKALLEMWWFRIFLAVLIIGFVTGQLALYFNKKNKKLMKKAEEEKELTNQVIAAFAKCIDMKDKYTRGHSFRVASYTKMIAEKLGRFTEEEIENYYNIALLHDIGKISIPDRILNKPGRLDDEEFVIMKSHAWNGYEILKEIKIMPDLALGAGYHHERYNGAGYPNHLEGNEEIPYVAQIIAVADSFDAMFTARVYKKKMPLSDVVAELERCKNTHYNPEIVNAFLDIISTGIFDDEEKEEEKVEKEIQKEAKEEADAAEKVFRDNVNKAVEEEKAKKK